MRRYCAEVPGADSVALMRLSRAISKREGVSGSTLSAQNPEARVLWPIPGSIPPKTWQ